MPYLGSTPNASFSSRTKQDFTANGSTTAFTLSSAVASPNDIEVFVGNVRQEPTDAYTVNGTTLTMSAAPANGINFYVLFKGLEENSVVPADGIITAAKLHSAALNPITLDTSNNRVGIGTTSPSKPLHVSLPNGSGATPRATAVAVIDGNDNTQLDILGGSSSILGINFGDSNDNDQARITCNTTSGSRDMGFAVNGSTRMTIQEGGQINMNDQPAVNARASYTNIPVNTVTVANLDAERFDVGNNLSNNTFTAPVTGKYLYTYTIYFVNVDTASTALGVQVVTSNKQYENWFDSNDIGNSDFYYTATSSQVCDMDINDTLQFKVYCGGGSAQTDIHTDSHISIMLVA